MRHTQEHNLNRYQNYNTLIYTFNDHGLWTKVETSKNTLTQEKDEARNMKEEKTQDKKSLIEYTDYELDSIYRESILISDAQAELEVNHTQHYKLTLDSIHRPYAYKCDYIPQAGDYISIKVSAQGYDDITASTHIGEQPKIEVVSKEVIFSKKDPNKMDDDMNHNLQYGEDSVMAMTLRISDPAHTHNFYRLRVMGVAKKFMKIAGETGDTVFMISDIYSSDDLIFADNLLTKPFGEWEARFSTVFDDHLFNGENYEFTVQSRKRSGTQAHVAVELQALSPELYYFLKSYMIFRFSTNDVYTSPIGLYSNVTNGWGYLGSLSYDRHIVYY